MINGNMVHSVALSHFKTHNDVKVFGGFRSPADASYKNLVWENLPAQEIFFNVHTPAIVSLE